MKSVRIPMFRRAALFGASLSVALTLSHSASAKFEFQEGDTVAVIGNALADRFQYHGWLETVVQSQTQDKKVTFRNLGFPGDHVAKRPRSKGFTSPEDYLTHIKADVIFVMFGYNESFGGEAGVSKFKGELASMIDSYRELKPNGEAAPRFVLFSPIAHEDLKNPNLPDGKGNNTRLALYGAAIKAVATEKGTEFVDLYETTQALYAKAETPLTINGIHLTEEGTRQVSEVIGKQLFGAETPAGSALQLMREAVVDKNWHWFNRYRAADGNDVWGGRSGLKFTDGQTNAEVLQHELSMLDVMTMNRDPKIWARAKGGDADVDDSNVPAPIPVKSNVGGGSRSSNPDKEGTVEYQSGEEVGKTLKVPDGFEIKLFADEKRFPEMVNPVQMQVDGKGRLWVAAWTTYPKWEPLKKMDDKLLILPDENRDGVADKVIVFAEVHNPLGFEFWNGGVIVTSQPDIIFLKDTDGDDVADVRIVLLQGIGSSDTHHAANNLIYGPDGAIYWQSGIFLQNNWEHPWGPNVADTTSSMYRFDPRRFTISVHAGNSPNPHGISFDRWGYHYANDGTGGRAYQVRPQGNGFRMHELLKKQVRPVAADEIVSSDNFPDEMQGDFLICNTIGFLGLKQYKLHRDGYERTEKRRNRKTKEEETVTVTYKPGEVWGEPVGDLLNSGDRNFRPTDAIFGSDGALYIADWQNVIIGHMQHNVRDPNRDHKHGRIYRMVNKAKPLQAPVAIDGEPIAKLLDVLKHSVDGVRQRARVELSERDSKEVIAATKEWVKGFDAKKAEDAHHLLEALWLHQQHNVKNAELLTALLQSPEQHARIAAGTVQHHWYVVDPTKNSPAAEEEEEASGQKPGVFADSDTLTEVRIGTVVEKMSFDLSEFTVKAGKKLRITFANPDFMPHNIVFVQPGAADEIGLAAVGLGAKGFEAQWVPQSDKIIASSALVDHKGEDVVEFAAPTKVGDYQFVCTFPGHHTLMRGVMKVVE